jgi:uncharacterized protein (DUF1697 family)
VTVTTYAALLRGVNLGARNRVPMARWRAQLVELGYTGVVTHLQSGNAVFQAGVATPAALARDIADALEADLGIRVPVVMRTGPELAHVVAHHPLREVSTDPSRLIVTFLSHDCDLARLAALAEEDFRPDVHVVDGRELYVWCPLGVSETRLTAALVERRCGGVATARNWNTVTRLAELSGAEPAGALS